MALPPTTTSTSDTAPSSSAPAPSSMTLPDNSQMFEQMKQIFQEKEAQTLKANFMKVGHDIRMSLIRNIR